MVQFINGMGVKKHKINLSFQISDGKHDVELEWD